LFIKSINSKDFAKIQNALYQWIDRLQLAEPTIHYFIKMYGVEHIMNEHSFNKKDWIVARKKFLHLVKNRTTTISIGWVNP